MFFLENNQINAQKQNKTFGFYAKNAGLLILKFFLYVLYSAVVTLPVFLTTVFCTVLLFVSVATAVCVITYIPICACVVFLVYARLACLITLGAIFGAVVLAAIIIQIVAMCLANSEYGKEVSMKANQELNSWEVNIYIWKDIYSVYDKINAIGEQEKTNEKPNLNEIANININQEDINKENDKNLNIKELRSKNQNLNFVNSENISTNKEDNSNIKKMNLNQQPQKAENGREIKNSQEGASTEVPEQKIDQANEKKQL